MDISSSIILISIIILIIVSSFASAIETAVVACSFIKIKSMADGGNQEAKDTLWLQEVQPKIITTMLILNNAVNLAASTLLTVLVLRLFDESRVAIFTIVLTIIILIFGEIVPKHKTNKNPEEYVIKYRFFIIILYNVLRPFAYVLNGIAKFILKLNKIDMDAKEESFTEDELKTIVDLSHEEGVLETEEKDIIQNVFDFADKAVKDIMIPRSDIVYIDINANYDEILKIFKTERYTRIPIFDEAHENILGILNIKDFLLREIDDDSNLDLKRIMMEPQFCYESKKVSDVLNGMKKSRSNINIVLDEYGVVSGLVTLEDILEEIVGDIRDEYDVSDDDDIKKIKENDYLIKGSVSLDDINEKLGTDIKSDEFDSIGGIFISKVLDVPTIGQEVQYDKYHLKIEKMDNNHIELIRLSF